MVKYLGQPSKRYVRKNLQMKHWLKQCHVNSNKEMTSLSQEAFTLLYEFHSLMDTSTVFDYDAAKSLAFFVLSMPDKFLTELVHSMDIYKYYLTHNQHLKRTEILHYNKKHLSRADERLINIIFSFYQPSDYTDMTAFVTKGHSFIMPNEISDKIHMRELKYLDYLVAKNEMHNPIEVNYKDGNIYAKDATKEIVCRYHIKEASKR